ncbi:hypothetical protein GCM10023314_25270 [Algibacter agarivorans]|uniref:Uncharacterized protein n=1 Tax=Algibacter agarivorans TaxID=1109741 RepID=A0ABP9GUD4_9FLAO
MNTFEKVVFLEMESKQFPELPNSEYYPTYKKLTEKDIIDLKISNKIHEIQTCINTKKKRNS